MKHIKQSSRKVADMKKNQNGFTVLEVILLIVVVGLIGGAGYYVWNKNQTKTENTVQPTTQNKTEEKQTTENKPQPDITSDWQTYTNSGGKFTVKHPKDWVVAQNTSTCTSDTLWITLLAPSQSVGDECYGNQGQISIGASSDTSIDHLPSETGLTGYKKEPVTVSGISGYKVSGSLKTADTYYEKGAKMVSYSFTAKGKVFFFQYRQNASYPDLLNEFDTMVTKTLVLN